MDFLFGFCCFFGGFLNDACNFDAYFCFFASGTGGELGDGGEAGVDSCPGDDGEGECSSAARGDGGLMLGALSGDADLDACSVALMMM